MRYLLLFLSLSAVACAHRPPDPAAVQFGASAGLLAAGIGHEIAAEHSPPAACVAHVVLGSAATGAAAGVHTHTLDLAPIDVSRCGLDASAAPPPEVSTWVERVAQGVEIGLGLAVKLDCRTRAWLVGAAKLLRSTAPAVIAEIATPTGAVSVPPVHLSPCTGI